MPSPPSKTRYLSLLVALLLIMIAKFLLGVDLSYDLFNDKKVCSFLFTNRYTQYGFHVLGVLLAFTSSYLLDCALLPSFLLLVARSLILSRPLDFVYSFSSIAFFIISLSTRPSSRIQKFAPFLIILSGVYSAWCVSIIIEFVPIALFSFFSILFFWLHSHKIGNDDGNAAPDAIKMVGFIMLSFGFSFFIFGYLYGFPSYSTQFWKFHETLKIFPVLWDVRLVLSSFPAFLSHLEIRKFLLCCTLLLCAEFFRVLPLSTEPGNFYIIVQVSSSFFEIASLIFITGVSTRFIGLFSSAIYVSISFIMYFVFDMHSPNLMQTGYVRL